MGLGEFGPWHIAIVALVFVLLFGARKLPDAARGIGQSLRIFKAEMKAGVDGTPSPAAAPQASAAQPTTPAPAPAPRAAELPPVQAVQPTATTQQPTTTTS
jgi:sec-independent protein translocase protein TatA